MCGEALVDEVAQVPANRLAALPVGDAEVAHGILGKTVEAFAEGLVVDFLPHRQQPCRRYCLCKCDLGHSVLPGVTLAAICPGRPLRARAISLVARPLS